MNMIGQMKSPTYRGVSNEWMVVPPRRMIVFYTALEELQAYSMGGGNFVHHMYTCLEPSLNNHIVLIRGPRRLYSNKVLKSNLWTFIPKSMYNILHAG